MFIDLLTSDYQFGLTKCLSLLLIVNLNDIEAMDYVVCLTSFEWGYYYPRHGWKIAKSGKLPKTFFDDIYLANSQTMCFTWLFPEYMRLQSDPDIYPLMQILGCRISKTDILYLYPEDNNRLELNSCSINRANCENYASPRYEPISVVV